MRPNLVVAHSRLIMQILSLTCFAACPVVQGTEPVMPARQTIDVTTTPRHQLIGQLIDSTGRPVEDAEICLVNQRGQSMRSLTDSDGQFALSNIKPGLYQAVSDDVGVLVRIWSHEAGPPAAKPSLLLIDPTVLRGQGTNYQPGIGAGAYDGGVMRALSSPWVFAGLVGAGVAVPIIVANDSDGS